MRLFHTFFHALLFSAIIRTIIYYYNLRNLEHGMKCVRHNVAQARL